MRFIPIAGLLLLLIAGCGGQAGDACRDVVCETPPDDYCLDDSTLVEYQTTGSCMPADGACEYDSDERHCAQGCTDGHCRVDGQVWGFISLLEMNDTMDFSSGARAYFTAEPHYRNSLFHHAAILLTEVDRSGDCVLYTDWVKRFDPCNPPCDPDQECTVEGGVTLCKDLPAHFAVGTITFEGLKAPLELEPDQFDRYEASQLPDDLFDENDEVRAVTGGGELSPLTFAATGVAHLEIDSSQVTLEPDRGVTLSWTPAAADARVMVCLLTGVHDPTPPSAALICDVPDSQGQVAIDPSLVNGFLDRHIIIQKFSRIVRYTRKVQTPYGLDMEFLVGSSRGLELLFP